MANTIWLLEGADNTGKTTLANQLIEKYDAHYIHCSWSPDLEKYSMVEYLSKKFLEALDISLTKPVVLDRHVFSTVIYENIYRQGIWNKSDLQYYCSRVFEVVKQSKQIIPIICTLPKAKWEETFKSSEKEEMYEFSDKMIAIYDAYNRLLDENFLEGYGNLGIDIKKHDFINFPFEI